MTDPVFSFQTLEVSQSGRCLTVVLNRPKSFNALNDQLVDELYALFDGLKARRDIHVVVLRGQGKHFCAGLDLKEHEIDTGNVARALAAQQRISRIVIAMRRCPQVIVAVVHGAASGGGFALALASDIRILEREARMNAAFIKLGLGGCDIGSSYFLPRMIGASAAADFLLTGGFISAARALALGLTNDVVDKSGLELVVEAKVAELLHATPLGLRLTKDALNHALDASGLEAVIAMEDRNQVLAVQGEDFLEGVAAFLEKRSPRYAA